jgi:6-pyruvoyl-tetrahydropterin synthase
MQLFVENLTVIDFAYLHPEHGIEGESLICDVTLHGNLDAQGMIMDFGPMKKKIKAAIDARVDHCLVVAQGDAALRVEPGECDQLTLHYTMKNGDAMVHHSPAQAVFLLDAEAVTLAALKADLEHARMAGENETVERVEITLRHEEISGAYYHYAHGLKKHEGDCQRIAHGHRSKLRIWYNGAEVPQMAERWAARWKHVYLVTREDILEEYQQGGRDMLTMGYDAPQGRFELSYPAARCHLMETESTVEHIAQHIADSLAAEHEGRFTARAYEGVQKGAVGKV